LRIGAVSYLNSRPLICCLQQFIPGARLFVDVPSRLADELAAGRFDVALIPSIEYFRHSGYTIVSDACVACEGPVKSVMLYSRVPILQMRTLALDEGSRTSTALVRILLKEQFGLEPELQALPIGGTAEQSPADAVMLIGDRGIVAPDGRFDCAWDLGEQWRRWTGLPFVFAMWIARSDLALGVLDTAFSLARDEGVRRIDAIARCEGPRLGISEDACRSYLRDHLRFRLGPREREGLELFCRLAAAHGLIPGRAQLAFADRRST
jgi:chorismate dehydratase